MHMDGYAPHWEGRIKPDNECRLELRHAASFLRSQIKECRHRRDGRWCVTTTVVPSKGSSSLVVSHVND